LSSTVIEDAGAACGSGGFTNYSNGINWSDIGHNVANLSYKLISNPGTAAGLFNSTATDEYATMMLGLTTSGSSTPPSGMLLSH
jgi:hypothetical protein